MTQDEAQAEAVRRYGPDTIAKSYQQGMVEIVIDIADRLPGWNRKKFGPITQVLGYGKTWEEAFQNADTGQFKGPKANDNPSEHTTQASETFTQMRLFP